MKDIKIKKKYIIIMVITLIVGVGAVTLAYFQGNVINDLINGTTVSTGNIDVKISDTEVNVSNVNPIYNGSVNYEDATFKKTFTVTNSGTLNTCTDLYLKINSIADSLKSTDFRYMVINDETGTTLEGNFSTASNGNDLKIGSLYFFEGETSKKYTMYIWIEYQESKDQMTMLNKTMNATLFVKGKDVKTKDACDNRDTFRITYETYGKTNCTSDTVSKGGTATLCTPTSDGEEFQGWYTDNSYTNQVTSLTNVTEDTKLYAKWNCIFNGTLTQGTEFVKGQYTYRYMQEYGINPNTYTDDWVSIDESGWGVILTDKTSTKDVTSKMCYTISNIPVTSYRNLFSNSKAKNIDLRSFKTSSVTNMSAMFSGSEALSIDVSKFETNNVTSMQGMFSATTVTTLDVSEFDTSNVTDMGYMFMNTNAQVLDVSGFNTSKVTDMSGMFDYSKVKLLDVSSFDTSNVTDMSVMFANNNMLKTIYASNNFITTKVTASYSMFEDSTSLVGGSGTVYDSTKVDATYARIDGGTTSPGYFTLKK